MSVAPILRPGDRGDAVRDLQHRLVGAGQVIAPAEFDHFATTTEAAVRAFQTSRQIRVDGIVNSERHLHGLALHGFSRLPSKYPPAFGIDLHVDDSEGVQMEGDAHGFRVVVVRPEDERWAQRVLHAVAQAQAA